MARGSNSNIRKEILSFFLIISVDCWFSISILPLCFSYSQRADHVYFHSPMRKLECMRAISNKSFSLKQFQTDFINNTKNFKKLKSSIRPTKTQSFFLLPVDFND